MFWFFHGDYAVYRTFFQWGKTQRPGLPGVVPDPLVSDVRRCTLDAQRSEENASPQEGDPKPAENGDSAL